MNKYIKYLILVFVNLLKGTWELVDPSDYVCPERIKQI